jgi:ABC-2 type transport system permease protein
MVLYFQTFKIGLQNALVYRWNFLSRFLFGLFPLIGSYFLWTTVFSEQQSVGGYDLRQIISYFVALLVLDALASSTDDDFRIAYEIRQGVLNQSLLKPMNYCLYQLSVFGATRFVYALTVVLPIIILILFLRDYVIIPKSLETWILISLTILGSAFIQFLISLCIGLMAFWLLEISAVSFSIFGLEYLLGGHIFPLDIMPQDIYRMALILPFAYEFYFPVSVWNGRISGQEAWQGLAIQWGWVLILWLVSQCLWNNGLRKYTAVGG